MLIIVLPKNTTFSKQVNECLLKTECLLQDATEDKTDS